MTSRRHVLAGGLALVLAPAVLAQPRDHAAADPCPAAASLAPSALHGLWRLVLWPEGGSEDAAVSTGAVLFGPHPEHPDSVRGRLRRSGPGADLEAELAGDVAQDGSFGLDESEDGRRMSAVWAGEPQDCVRSIRGTRRPAEGRPATEPTLHFHLRKLPDRR